MQIIDTLVKKIGYVKTTLSGEIVECNERALAILNLPHQAVVGKRLLSIIDWSTESLCALSNVFSNGITEENGDSLAVLDFPCQDGHRFIELTGLSVVDEKGNTYLEFSLFDVTAREATCPMRNKSDMKSRYIQELGGIGTVETIYGGSNETMMLRGDEMWQEIFGFASELVLFSDFIKRVPEQFYATFFELQEKVQSGAERFELTFMFEHPTKGEIWLEAHGRSINRGGEKARTIIMVQDITLEKHKVEELKKTHRKLQKAIELANLGYFEVQMKTGAVYWDENCYAIHNYPSTGEITYEFFIRNIVHPDDIVQLLEHVKKEMRSGKRFFIEYRAVTPEGEVRWIKENIEPILDDCGIVIEIHGAKQDITDEKHREIALENTRIALEVSNQRLKEMVTHDELTKIYNRRMFNERFEYEWRRAIRSETPLSLAIVDIDHFKEFNDLYGHLAGDICLSTVAETLERSVTRSTDMVARYGGEEFAIILPDTTEPAIILEACRKNIEAMAMSHKGSRHESVTISIGCATQIPRKKMGKNDLLKQADEQLYKAKNQGRNQVCTIQLG